MGLVPELDRKVVQNMDLRNHDSFCCNICCQNLERVIYCGLADSRYLSDFVPDCHLMPRLPYWVSWITMCLPKRRFWRWAWCTWYCSPSDRQPYFQHWKWESVILCWLEIWPSCPSAVRFRYHCTDVRCTFYHSANAEYQTAIGSRWLAYIKENETSPVRWWYYRTCFLLVNLVFPLFLPQDVSHRVNPGFPNGPCAVSVSSLSPRTVRWTLIRFAGRSRFPVSELTPGMFP